MIIEQDVKKVLALNDKEERIFFVVPKASETISLGPDNMIFKLNKATYEVDGLFKAIKKFKFSDNFNKESKSFELLYGDLTKEIEEGEMVVLSVKNHFNARDDLSQMFSNLDDLFHLYEKKKMTMILVTFSDGKVLDEKGQVTGNMPFYFERYNDMYDSISNQANILILNLISNSLFGRDLFAEREENYVTKNELVTSLEKMGKEMGTKVGEMGAKMGEMGTSLKQEMGAKMGEMGTSLKQEMGAKIGEMETSLKQEMDTKLNQFLIHIEELLNTSKKEI